MLRSLENKKTVCGRGLGSLANALPLVPVKSAVIYERQQQNMQFPQKYIPLSKVLHCKIAKANWIFVEVAGYKLQHPKHRPHPLGK